MSNIIQIKHGKSVNNLMPSNKLQPYELGFTTDTGYLYIGNPNTDLGHSGINVHYSDQTGSVLKVDNGGEWWQFRDTAAVKYKFLNDATVGFKPLFSSTCKDGAWSLGAIDKYLSFVYQTNADYESSQEEKKNIGLKQLHFYPDNVFNQGAWWTGDSNSVQTGTLPLNYGGTGATNAAEARTNLGLGTVAIESTVPVSKGGTGLTALTAGYALIGNGASSVSLRAIQNITAVGHCNYNSGTAANLVNLNTLAYWNGRYNDDYSNLAYCAKGAFGTIITKNTNDYLPSSGGSLSGPLTLVENKYFTNNNAYGLNCFNSDVININGIYFCDTVDSAGQGINFYRGTGVWDTLYSANGALKFHPNRPTQTVPNGYEVLHKGITSEHIAAKQVSGTTTAIFTLSREFSFYLIGIKHTGYGQWDTIVVPRVSETREYHCSAHSMDRRFTVAFSSKDVQITNVTPTGNETYEVWGIF